MHTDDLRVMGFPDLSKNEKKSLTKKFLWRGALYLHSQVGLLLESVLCTDVITATTSVYTKSNRYLKMLLTSYITHIPAALIPIPPARSPATVAVS